MNNATLKDVAREAGVSVATVSLVLNNKGQISQDVRERVYDAAKTLDYSKPIYTPSAAKQLNHIAVLLYEDYEKAFVWNFYRRIIIQLESIITREQYYPVIIPVHLEQETQDLFEKVVSSRVVALFSVDYANQELFQRLEDRGIPVVIINNSSLQTEFHTVCVDDFHGAYEGTRHLLQLGHTKIAYLEYHRPDMLNLLNDRFIGFKKALDEENIPFSERLRLTVDLLDMEELRQKLHAIFQQEHPPTALFIHDDYLAARTIVVLQQMNLQLPDDVSIIAPGDTLDYSQPFIPQLTTMSINNELMGKFAGEMLLERIQDQDSSPHTLKVNQQLVKRGSCKSIA
jgi:DNA-binding LacI/PurR family transcriptional regulator